MSSCLASSLFTDNSQTTTTKTVPSVSVQSWSLKSHCALLNSFVPTSNTHLPFESGSFYKCSPEPYSILGLHNVLQLAIAISATTKG